MFNHLSHCEVYSWIHFWVQKQLSCRNPTPMCWSVWEGVMGEVNAHKWGNDRCAQWSVIWMLICHHWYTSNSKLMSFMKFSRMFCDVPSKTTLWTNSSTDKCQPDRQRERNSYGLVELTDYQLRWQRDCQAYVMSEEMPQFAMETI